MNPPIKELLRQYWGHDDFRPLQEDIIGSVMQGHDTLALLPTGAGKSVCYQIPALGHDGICLVISPLISLIKDQVDQLRAKGIRSLAVFSGMNPREIDIALDNAIYGNFKFLYLSPERLETDIFKERAPQMKVNLIAVDEAHCISEWGYDFRPAYHNISNIREYFPKVPILALTATATSRVKEDIQEKLLFRADKEIFTGSFDRQNLVYAVTEVEDKKKELIKVVNKVRGSTVIYVNTRNKTKELAELLLKNNISADHYHGGLQHDERANKQDKWMSGALSVMIATNAFGMGIDKADVRLVLHYDLPESLEAYYQEAGRAGRDGKRSFAIALTNDHDRLEMSAKADLSMPEPKEVVQVYHALGNYYQLPEGSGLGQNYDFDIAEFSRKYDLKPIRVQNALKALEKAGYIAVSSSVFLSSRLKITTDQLGIYSFEIAHKTYEPLIKTILRSYGGCFEEYVDISEQILAQRCKLSTREVIKMLQELHRLNLIDYTPQTNAPQITYLSERVRTTHLHLDQKYMAERKSIYLSKVHAMLDYSSLQHRCRGKAILKYFGEDREDDCGHCDYCLKEKKTVTAKTVLDFQSAIIRLLMKGGMSIEELMENIPGADEASLLSIVRRMLDEKLIRWRDNVYLEINA